MERSNIYVDINQFDKAIKDLSDALDSKPSDPKILYKRGLAYYRNKEFKKAVKDLDTSLDNHPFETYEADIYYHLGISYSNREMFEKSIPYLTKAIELAYNEPSYIH
jgi:tetratricopeptide (TPR) repeat protein